MAPVDSQTIGPIFLRSPVLGGAVCLVGDVVRKCGECSHPKQRINARQNTLKLSNGQVCSSATKNASSNNIPTGHRSVKQGSQAGRAVEQPKSG